MALFYKLFQGARIVFSFSFLLVFIMGAHISAHANEDVFTVEDVKVDVSAENAIAAREKAFNDAQTQAFQTLAERMLADEGLQGFTAPDVQNISLMIKDYEVSNEKLSAKRYSANYKFRFRDDDVRVFFGSRGMAYTDMSSQTLLILPFYVSASGKGALLWSPYNVWMRAWSETDMDSKLVPMELPIGDLMDVRDINEDDGLNYNPRSLNSMIERYNAGEAVIAIAQAKPELNTLDIQIYRTDRGQPEFVQQISQTLRNEQDSVAFSVAVVKVKEALRADWKNRTMIAGSPNGYNPYGSAHKDATHTDRGVMAGQNHIQVRARFISLEEWTQIKGRLQTVSGVYQTDLKALSPSEAYIDVYFSGDMGRLNIALQQANLRLEGVVQPGANTVYDLIYDRYGRYGRKSSYEPAVNIDQARPSSLARNYHDPAKDIAEHAADRDDIWADRRTGNNFYVPSAQYPYEARGVNTQSQSVQAAPEVQKPLKTYSAEF
ncbi:MAG: DUF2066 domain-containing protein [Micavibrio sp.]|nr:DUF2066 domain-containing protein [Micavibrio sp.]